VRDVGGHVARQREAERLDRRRPGQARAVEGDRRLVAAPAESQIAQPGRSIVGGFATRPILQRWMPHG
jgi:hypothetical protein